MKKYYHIFLNEIAKMMTYRSNFFIRFVIIFLDTVISLFMWHAIYAANHSGQIAGISASQMTLYLLVVNLLTLIFSPNPIYNLSSLIHSGNLTLTIIRPINLLFYSFVQYLGSTFPFLVLYLAIFLHTIIINPMKGIVSLGCIAIIYFMFFLLITWISLCSFWLIQVWPLKPIFSACFYMLGGQLFPLQVLPSSFHWLTYNPFALAGNQMALISMGKLSFRSLLLDVIVAIGWIVILECLIQLEGRRGLKKFEGVGV